MKPEKEFCWIILLVIISLVNLINAAVDIRIHNDFPSNVNSFSREHYEDDQEMVQLKPVNFSGPDHLKVLIGHCYLYVDKRYEYRMCPFANVTQEEIETYHAPYKGVLGVWGEWEIQNNKFTAMVYSEGSICGSRTFRSTKIFIKCGLETRLQNVTEPSRCTYEGFFETPLACGTNAMVVYPRLATELQQEWNMLESEKETVYTSQGYKDELDKIFVKAGFKLSDEGKEFLRDQITKALEKKPWSCELQLEQLRQRVSFLESELEERNAVIREMKCVDKMY